LPSHPNEDALRPPTTRAESRNLAGLGLLRSAQVGLRTLRNRQVIRSSPGSGQAFQGDAWGGYEPPIRLGGVRAFGHGWPARDSHSPSCTRGGGLAPPFALHRPRFTTIPWSESTATRPPRSAARRRTGGNHGNTWRLEVSTEDFSTVGGGSSVL